jgi:hypothetical protein
MIFRRARVPASCKKYSSSATIGPHLQEMFKQHHTCNQSTLRSTERVCNFPIDSHWAFLPFEGTSIGHAGPKRNLRKIAHSSRAATLQSEHNASFCPRLHDAMIAALSCRQRLTAKPPERFSISWSLPTRHAFAVLTSVKLKSLRPRPSPRAISQHRNPSKEAPRG